MPHSTQRAKPEKPYPDFPLTGHASGQWCKKINGKLVYFGKDWQAALDRYLKERDYLKRGLPVPTDADGLTVRQLCNIFLTAKDGELQAGEIGARYFGELKAACKLLVDEFQADRVVASLGPQDFELLRTTMASRWGAVRLANEIGRMKAAFNYGYDAGLLERPVRFGPTFKKPAKRRMRAAKRERGKKLFSAKEVRALIDGAEPHLKAMILLAINGGMHNADVGTLPFSSLDLKKGWIDYPRRKTEIERRFPLWDETKKALKESISKRPTPKPDFEDNVFITAQGTPYWTEVSGRWVGQKFRQLLNKKKLHRQGVGFSALRHTFRTAADRCKDTPAILVVMGHSDATISDHYREEVEDDRLAEVVETVRQWLEEGAPPAAAK